MKPEYVQFQEDTVPTALYTLLNFPLMILDHLHPGQVGELFCVLKKKKLEAFLFLWLPQTSPITVFSNMPHSLPGHLVHSEQLLSFLAC